MTIEPSIVDYVATPIAAAGFSLMLYLLMVGTIRALHCLLNRGKRDDDQ